MQQQMAAEQQPPQDQQTPETTEIDPKDYKKENSK